MRHRLIIVDDHDMLRQGLRVLLEQDERIEVVGEAADGLEGIRIIKELRPDLAVMDVTMPNLNGIETTRRLKSECPETKVLALSMHTNRRFVIEMLKAGAAGYVVKSSGVEELMRAIRAVCEGLPYISPSVTSVLMEKLMNKDEPVDNETHELTPREREVLQLLAEGKKTREMAELLHVSEKTIQSHRRNITEKLKIRTLPELTKFAIQHGLTSLDSK